MKKSILLLASGLIASGVNAQEAHKSVLFEPIAQNNARPVSAPNAGKFVGDILGHTRSSMLNKTSAVGGSRWYNYGDYQYSGILGGSYTTGGFGGQSLPYMWFDTSSRSMYSGPTLDYVNLVSVSQALDPMFAGFNDPAVFPGMIGVNTTSAYSVDSVEIIGVYARKITDAATKDTLRIALTYGAGNSTSNLGVSGWESSGTTGFPYVPYSTDTLLYLQTYHDSTKNILNNKNGAGTTLGPAPIVFDIILNQTDTAGYGTTFFAKTVKVPTALAVPAGNFPAMSVTFKSGNPLAPHMPPGNPTFGDTVHSGTTGAPDDFGMFRPLVTYKSDASGNPQFMPYTIGLTVASFRATKDLNVGLFKQEPAGSWGGSYIPSWSWSTSGGSAASAYQYPAWGGFHIVCPTCPWTSSLGTAEVKTIKSINVYPNPANGELNVSFTSRANADVTLTNMVGQVVATQNVNTGMATFNTAALPAGIYIYTIVAGGERITGRVVVAH